MRMQVRIIDYLEIQVRGDTARFQRSYLRVDIVTLLIE